MVERLGQPIDYSVEQSIYINRNTIMRIFVEGYSYDVKLSECFGLGHPNRRLWNWHLQNLSFVHGNKLKSYSVIN